MSDPIDTALLQSEAVKASKLLRALFPNGVAAFEARAPVGIAPLDPVEATIVARAAPRRVAEFGMGRECARRALDELGVRGFSLRAGRHREPLWPQGVTGSITHTEGFCGAAAAHRSVCDSLGIDAERRAAVRPRLWRQIATPEELRRLEELSPARAADMATILFSAKESFFKCQFPLTREWLNFADVSVTVDPPHFEITPRRALALADRAPPPWRGRCELEAVLVFTAVHLSAAPR